MKVLMLGWDFPARLSGGLGTACRGLTRALTEVGTEVLFVVPRGQSPALPEGVRALLCEEVPEFRSAAWKQSAIRESLEHGRALDPYQGKSFRAAPQSGDVLREIREYARAVGELARVQDFDLIHAHDWMSFPAAAHARDVSGKPLVLHVHSTEHDRSGEAADLDIVEIESRALGNCDRVLCVSERTRSDLITRYGVDPARVSVLHNGVEPVTAHRSSEETARPKRVLFLGRVTAQKDPATFLRAAQLVLDTIPQTQFVVAGDGDLFVEMVGLSRELGLNESIRFAGFLEQADTDRLYDEVDVFVMPSRAEPFGLVSLEAMAHGVPVVATRGSGVLETLPSALAFETGDVEGLADRIVALLTRPSLRKAVLDQGTREVAQANWKSRGRALLGLYEELAS